MKKLISCLLAVAILIALVACGKDAQDEKIKEVAQQIGLTSTSIKTNLFLYSGMFTKTTFSPNN